MLAHPKWSYEVRHAFHMPNLLYIVVQPHSCPFITEWYSRACSSLQLPSTITSMESQEKLKFQSQCMISTECISLFAIRRWQDSRLDITNCESCVHGEVQRRSNPKAMGPDCKKKKKFSLIKCQLNRSPMGQGRSVLLSLPFCYLGQNCT